LILPGTFTRKLLELRPSEKSSVQNSEQKINRKIDRSESIKRAEEMLSGFMREQREGLSLKRPEFMRNKVRQQAPQHAK